MARYSFPAWDRDLQERVNATGGEGMPGIVQNFDLFNRAGVLTCNPKFLEDLDSLVGVHEAFLTPYEKALVAKKKSLGKNEYLVPVSYTPLPSFSELEHEFGQGNVSNIFDGRPFKNHASCVGVDETSGDKIFLVKHFGREAESEDNIVEMDKLGYRPATHIEACAFQKKNPDLQRHFYIVALGSFAMDGDVQFVAVLRSYSGGRVFGDNWFGSRWSADDRFLFVRK